MKKYAVYLLCLLAFGLGGCSTPTYTTVPEMPNPDLTATGSSEIYFNNLPVTCTIELYTQTGGRVRTISVTNGNGQAAWDLKNDAGELLVSGIYDYLILSSGDDMKGKVVIIR